MHMHVSVRKGLKVYTGTSLNRDIQQRYFPDEGGSGSLQSKQEQQQQNLE